MAWISIGRVLLVMIAVSCLLSCRDKLATLRRLDKTRVRGVGKLAKSTPQPRNAGKKPSKDTQNLEGPRVAQLLVKMDWVACIPYASPSVLQSPHISAVYRSSSVGKRRWGGRTRLSTLHYLPMRHTQPLRAFWLPQLQQPHIRVSRLYLKAHQHKRGRKPPRLVSK